MRLGFSAGNYIESFKRMADFILSKAVRSIKRRTSYTTLLLGKDYSSVYLTKPQERSTTASENCVQIHRFI